MSRQNKHPLNLDRFTEQRVSPTDLVAACQDFIEQEHYTQYIEREEYYNRNLQQRLRTGESLCVKFNEITDVEESNVIKVEGELYYDWLPYSNPNQLISAIRAKESKDTSTGSFRVGIPLDEFGNETVTEPYKYKNQVQFTIDSLNLQTGEVTLSTISGNPYNTGTYKYKHKQATTDQLKAEEKPNEYHHLTDETVYILDPSLDSITAERINKALNVIETNHVAQLFDDIITDPNVDLSTKAFDSKLLYDFAGWMANRPPEKLPGPNTKQHEFIRDADTELTVLQGPPGTGKTSGAFAPAIVARILAYRPNTPCRTLVTGPSNLSIDEALADVAEIVKQYRDDPSTDDQLDNVELIRISPKPDNPPRVESYDFVTYSTLYNDESTRNTIQKRLFEQTDSNPSSHTIIFSTPSRTWTVATKLLTSQDAEELATNEQLEDGDESETSQQLNAVKLWDLLAIDEASMMDIPQVILAGTFYQRGGNILLCGDHRQLPPVKQHDWNNDQKPTIRTLAPYLSSINFCRALTGENIELLDDTQQELLAFNNNDDPQFEFKQLETTYRCHKDVADFLERWVYSRDNLEYRSERTETINYTPSSNTPKGIKTALKSESPITLITYDTDSYQQSNPLEALITSHLLNELNDNTTSGVVTPHNAQRGQLTQQLNNINEQRTTPIDADVDTVERFQGGERDVIIINGTVSDPNYIAAESEFLLNLNRLNVAMSRMKKKLVIVASENIFNHISVDIEEYNQSLLWKGIVKASGLEQGKPPKWSGPLAEFLRDEYITLNDKNMRINPTQQLSIYHAD